MEERIRELTRSSNGVLVSGGPWCPIIKCYLALRLGNIYWTRILLRDA